MPTAESSEVVLRVAPIAHREEGIHPDKTHRFRKSFNQPPKLSQNTAPVFSLNGFCNFFPLKQEKGHHVHHCVYFPDVAEHLLDFSDHLDMADVVVAE